MPETSLVFIIALVICLVSGPFLIPFLERLKFGQQVRSDGPQTHLQKAGTPTMGGLMLFLSMGFSLFWLNEFNLFLGSLFFVFWGFGCIGFLDDFIKIVLKRPLGLRAYQKIIGQTLISGLFIYFTLNYLGRGTTIFIPGWALSFNLGWLYPCFALLVIIGTVNAVNLTDGLDGLAAGVTAFAALGYFFIGKIIQFPEISLFSIALLGSCLGFLFFNIYPARIFMGDTGSLALGGALGGLAILTKTELLLVILGGIYVLEALSVILQVLYFKYTKGRRLFLMAPLHHHFELKGWSERQVVFAFWGGAALFTLAALLLIQ